MENTSIKALIGLGNPGSKFQYNRHNIGFLVLDELVRSAGGTWQHKDLFDLAEVYINYKKILCLKPSTFMNVSGKVIPFLQKQGIKPEEIMVVHDELEKPFGNISIKFGGSAKGHNGLRSIITFCGDQFYRLRFGIGRPERKEDVSDWVLANFSEPKESLNSFIVQAAQMLEKYV
jgi:PTH1 family peptidyl-tRNA hydrolase